MKVVIEFKQNGLLLNISDMNKVKPQYQTHNTNSTSNLYLNTKIIHKRRNLFPHNADNKIGNSFEINILWLEGKHGSAHNMYFWETQ